MVSNGSFLLFVEFKSALSSFVESNKLSSALFKSDGSPSVLFESDGLLYLLFESGGLLSVLFESPLEESNRKQGSVIFRIKQHREQERREMRDIVITLKAIEKLSGMDGCVD